MRAQEPVLSFSFPNIARSSLPEHILDGIPTVRALPLSHLPLPFLGRNCRRKPRSPGGLVSTPGIAFHSTPLFDWITLTGAVVPPHAEPSDHDHDDEGIQD